MKKTAFTIAEILVTLAIIGVIAALAVPGLINNSSNKQFESGFKKAYAELNSATEKVMMNNGGTMLRAFGNSTDNAMLSYANFFKAIRTCRLNTHDGECWHRNNTTYLLNRQAGSNRANNSSLILKNGMMIVFYSVSDSCTGSNFSRNSSTGPETCLQIDVDINGVEKPNTYGRDIFMFIVARDGLYPHKVAFGNNGNSMYDGSGNYTYCEPNVTQTWNGHHCAGRIITEGGMKY